MKRTDTLHKQHGFTLVEIMIAITIGLVMLAGILQISQANRESSRLQRNMGFMQENMRTAMELLIRDIRMAGYFEDDDPDAPILVAPAPFFNVSNVTTIVDTDPVTADGGDANSDQITLNYQSDTDCLGQATPVIADNQFAINHYFIRNQQLMCRGNGGAAPQPLVENVENLQILYGENTGGDPNSANRYVRADLVGDMANVVGVRIGMRFISRDAIRPASDSYTLLDAASFTPGANDRRLRREITTTISLRNPRTNL